MVLVACADWLAVELRAARVHGDIRTIVNGTDFLAEEERVVRSDDAFRIAVVGADLSDSSKQDHNAIKRVAQIPGVKIFTAGRHSPFSGGNIRNLGMLPADELARLYNKSDALLFTSTVDYYPLTLLEAMAARLPVLAYSSKAADEILLPVGISTFAGAEHILRVVEEGPFGRELVSIREALGSFVPKTVDQMVDDYERVYLDLL